MEITDTKIFEISSVVSVIEDDLEKAVGLAVIANLDREFYVDFIEYSVDRVLFGESAMDYDPGQPNPEDNLVSLGLVPDDAKKLLAKWEDTTRERFLVSGVATNVKYDFRKYDFEISLYPGDGPINIRVETTTPLEEGSAARL